MNEDKNNPQDEKTEPDKLDQILLKLNTIEESIFKLIEDKLTTFRGELSQMVDNSFKGLQNYLESSVAVVRDELEDKLINHEKRITILEKESGLKDITDDPEDLALRNRRKRFIKQIVISCIGITVVNATVLVLILTHFKK